MKKPKKKEYTYYILKDGIEGVSWCAETLQWKEYFRPVFYFTLEAAEAALATIPGEDRSRSAIHKIEFLNDVKKVQALWYNNLEDEEDGDFESPSDLMKRLM